MRRITQKLDVTLNNVIGRIKVYLEAREPFFYGHKIVHRYAVVRRVLYHSADPSLSTNVGDYFNYQLYRAIVACIDYQRAIVGYRDGDGRHFCIGQCYTTQKLINAVKHAKKHQRLHVIDLHTGNLIQTNG